MPFRLNGFQFLKTQPLEGNDNSYIIFKKCIFVLSLHKRMHTPCGKSGAQARTQGHHRHAALLLKAEPLRAFSSLSVQGRHFTKAGGGDGGESPCLRCLCNTLLPFGNVFGPRFMSINIVLQHDSTATWHYLTGMYQHVAISHISHLVASKFSLLSRMLPRASNGANTTTHSGGGAN